MIEALVPSCARLAKSVAASMSTRANPISSAVRKRVSTKNVVKKPTATPIYVTAVPLILCLAMMPIV